MPVWEADAKSIMPLISTRQEIDATYSLLKKLDQTWPTLFSGCRLQADELSRIILVGSGDSWTAALTAAAWINTNSHLHCLAYQSFEFLSTDPGQYGRETLIVIISASGRPSPVTEALKYALMSQAQVLGLTNSSGSPFSKLTENMVFTGAIKNGIPTQSTSATLYLLLRLVDVIKGFTSEYEYFPDLRQDDFIALREEWQEKDRERYRKSSITFLGNHLTWGISLAGSNLLSCGPQLHADFFPVEEFHHSLRLNQVDKNKHFILLPGLDKERGFYLQTHQELLGKGASAEIIDFPFKHIKISHLFYVMQYLYEMSWHLAVDFIEQGGKRVSHQESI